MSRDGGLQVAGLFHHEKSGLKKDSRLLFERRRIIRLACSPVLEELLLQGMEV
eukprot:CAMPEP_0119315366 /NCGR_PEP_ID=MMETSP1333-20130426/35533_1 /TAXON_ID=418940 /ORGANISM="Scyphosphaera apsteinii, Strain RCC1455" /LENGTH=52 /DNA_ID=CAMNT_0007320705 /DNA_START=8 /DNA_END=162 /DNA_ORIENTATION=+